MNTTNEIVNEWEHAFALLNECAESACDFDSDVEDAILIMSQEIADLRESAILEESSASLLMFMLLCESVYRIVDAKILSGDFDSAMRALSFAPIGDGTPTPARSLADLRALAREFASSGYTYGAVFALQANRVHRLREYISDDDVRALIRERF